MPLSPRQRLLVRGSLACLGVLGVAAAFVVVGVVPPSSVSFFPKCWTHLLTGLHCPGCGLTRATHAALNGRFAEALSQNVLAVAVVPFLVFVVLRELWRFAWEIPPRPSRFRPPAWLIALLVVGVLAFTVARNIPAYPFTLLAPRELQD
ncbi:MAG: DUF2752 domain-containing protein [Fimbriiglobus sp.]|jgi:hypothetical protein|nr:DUF2752 domain-containing protein [Fimbriiglobus sp.]